ERPMRQVALIFLMLAAACGGQSENDAQTEGVSEMPDDGATPAPAGAGPEILWDEWGVPHIRAETRDDAFFAFGWAQMRGRGDLVLTLMAQGRGRAAEYLGPDYYETDALMWSVGLPQKIDAIYAAQGPAMQASLDAFADGINAYAAAHADALDPALAGVLPVTARDVLGHAARVTHLRFVAGKELQRIQGMRRAASAAAAPEPTAEPGSNGWAVAPAKSESGASLLLANPHLPWKDFYYFFEAQMTTPDVNAYGVSLIGMPLISIAFNDRLGWTHTVNTFDGADLYAFDLAEGGYIDMTGETAFETEIVPLKVATPDGPVDKPLTVRRTSAGPVVHADDKTAYALKVAGLEPERLGITEQYWEMARAQSLDEFEAAMGRMQMPFFNTVYADQAGEIFYLFNALSPVRKKGDAALWAGVLDGADPDLRWDDYQPYSALPKVKNPPSHFVQNANETPWTATVPVVLDPADYPADLVPPMMTPRAQQSLSLLMADPSISFDEFVAYSQSPHLAAADQVLDDLIAAARAAEDDALLAEAADALASWDRNATPESRGAVLFFSWINALAGAQGVLSSLDPGAYEAAWSLDDAATGPTGLKDDAAALAALKGAAQSVKGAFGALDAPWGAVARVKRDGVDIPVGLAPGGLGAFRVGWVEPDETGAYELTGGTSYVAAIEFAERPRAQAILAYGNFEKRPDWVRAQWPLLAENRLRTVNFETADVDAAAVEREVLTRAPASQ
ncbi:MAG: penicillin acylase family protein, partial [Pseudomonadota bacterium]